MRCFVPALVMLLGCAPAPADIAPGDAAIVGDGASDHPSTAVEEDARVEEDASADRASPTLADGAAPEGYEGVQAIFRRSCGGYCHAGGVDVGASLVLTSEDGTRPRLLDRPSRQVPRMMLVVPGDPDASYLMRKVDGTMGSLPECASDRRSCGIPMPYAFRGDAPAVVMPVEERDLIRRWITAGAPGLTGP